MLEIGMSHSDFCRDVSCGQKLGLGDLLAAPNV
jgi:hypothetical protein